MVAVALARAQEAREQGAAASKGAERQFWHEMERRWMKLAQSTELAERLDAFLDQLRSKTLN